MSALTVLLGTTAATTPLRVLPCSFWNGGSDSEGWSLTPAADGAVTIANARGAETLCLDAGASTTPIAAPCDAGSASQQWRIDHKGLAPGVQHFYTGAATADDPNANCLMVAGSTYTLGPGLLLAPCAQTRFRQHAVLWSVNGTSLVSHGGGCCGDIFATRPVCLAVDTQPRCADLGVAAAPWCDASRNASARAAALLGAMTLAEKASNMDSHNFGVPRLAVPPNIFSEALHGMCSGCGAPHTSADGSYTSTGCPTSFPQVISMGASWNRTLWSAVGSAVSDEVRGLYSQGSAVAWEGALFLWAPNVNPFRDPRWGRGQEVASEEPLACAEYAAHYIPALQSPVVDSAGRTFLKSVATVKHFYDYDLEGVPGGATSRQNIDVNVSARDQTEFFSPPFEAAVRRGKAASTMCSYNAVNGMPACLSDAMINGKLRRDWGFDGFVVSDCDAISDGATHSYIVEHFNGSLQVQAQQALRGGTDLNCGALFGEQNVGAVQAGLLREAELDKALLRIYTKAFELGVLDAQSQPAGTPNPNPYAALGAEVVDTQASRELARQGALQGQVLLKNEGTLPLDGSKLGSLALIGPHANGSTVFLGGPNYHGFNDIVDANTPLLRAQAKLPASTSVTYVQGCDVTSNSTAGFGAATAAAATADAVVLFLGLDDTVENEAKDRDSLELPGVQAALAREVAAVAKAPVVVVLVNGGPLAIGELKASAQVGAILEAFMPGQFGADAAMSLLLGEASPSGLLPVTVYDADFTARRPITNLDLRGSGGVTYRYFDGEPLWPFGFGLSFADFSFAAADAGAVLRATVAEAETGATPYCFEVQATSSANSAMTSDVVVLGFIGSSHADAPRNPKLCDFAREAAVAPGEARTVKLCIEALGSALALVDDNGTSRVLPGNYSVTAGVAGGVGGSGAGGVIGTLVVSQ